jgi:hypothetical protein
VIVFISRYGGFCLDGEPVVLAALSARERRFRALTQEEVLDAAALMTLGEGHGARDLVKAAFENPAAFMAERYPRFKAVAVPFESEHWTEMPVDPASGLR